MREFIGRPSDAFENVPEEEDKEYSFKVADNGLVESADNIIEFTESMKNNFIEIEYYNYFGKQNAKLFLKYIEKNPLLFKTILKDYKKITIGNNSDNTFNFEFCDYPIPIQRFISSIEREINTNKNFSSSLLLDKLEGKDIISADDELRYFENTLVPADRINSKLFFLDKQGNDFSEYYNPKFALLLNYCFDKNNYEFLYSFLKDEYTKEDESVVSRDLASKKNISILNSLLEKQIRILESDNGLGLDNFLANNLVPLLGIFTYNFSDISMCKEVNSEQIPLVDYDTTLKLVDSSLDFMDESGCLKDVFHEKIEDGTICIWDSNNPEEREKFINSHKRYDPDIWACYSGNGYAFVNNPLSGTLKDVLSITHEFAHLYSFLQNPNNRTSAGETFSEFQSIMFEMLACNNLKNEGYDPEVIDNLLNIRTNWIKEDYLASYGSMQLLLLYKKQGDITKEQLKTMYLNTNNPMINDDNVDWFVNDSINTANVNLICNNKTIQGHYKYILGYILSNTIVNKYDVSRTDTKEWILDLVEQIPRTDDSCEIFDAIGYDTEKMGFKRIDSSSSISNYASEQKIITKK